MRDVSFPAGVWLTGRACGLSSSSAGMEPQRRPFQPAGPQPMCAGQTCVIFKPFTLSYSLLSEPPTFRRFQIELFCDSWPRVVQFRKSATISRSASTLTVLVI